MHGRSGRLEGVRQRGNGRSEAYFASAATYRALTGRDLHSPRALEEQIRIVADVSEALFARLGESAAQEDA